MILLFYILQISDMTENNNKGNIASDERVEYKVVKNLLNDAGIYDYEESVVSHLLYLTYDHVSSILEDAIIFSRHANKKELDTDDVKLALKMYDEKHPNTKYRCKKVSSELAMKVNKIPLPEINSKNILRIPAQNALSATNYKLKPKEIHYIYENENGSVLLTSSSQTQEQRALLKRQAKIYSSNPTQKIVFRPNFNFKYVTNAENQTPILKKRKDN